jgi:hypothetical protein
MKIHKLIQTEKDINLDPAQEAVAATVGIAAVPRAITR